MKYIYKTILLLVFFGLCLSESMAQNQQQSLAIIRKDALSYVLYSDGSQELLPYFVIEAEGASEGLIRAKIMLPTKEMMYAYLDQDGNIKIQPKIPENYAGRVLQLSNQHMRLIGYNKDTEEERMLLFNQKGENVFPEGFENISEVGDNGWVFVHDKKYHGFYDLTLKKQLDLPDSLSGYYTGFSGGICLIENQEYQKGAINDKGQIIVPPSDAHDIALIDGVLLLSEGGKLSIVNKKGKTTTSIEGVRFDENLEFISVYFENGLLPLFKDIDEVVLIDKKGNQKITFSDAKSIIEFDGNVLTLQSQNDEYLAYDLTGKLLHTFTYRHMGGFVNGFSYFSDTEKAGFVDTSGRELLLDWDVLWDIRNGSMFF